MSHLTSVILSSPTRVPRVAVEMTAGTSADSIGLMNAVMRRSAATKDLRLFHVREPQHHSIPGCGCLFFAEPGIPFGIQ
jgi:hypothetical protein